ncbi:MAG: hypothetical protein ACYC8T_20325 [Myxococcaceae bacterium]
MSLAGFTALALAAAGCGAPRAPPPPRPAIWSEYLQPEQVREQLPAIARYGLDLNLAVARGRWSNEDTVAIVREADRHGVRVRFWPLVTFDEGYWACESNVEVVREHLRALMDLIEKENLPVDTFELDLEPHYRRVERLKELLAAGGGAVEVLDFFKAGVDPVAFAAARREYRALVQELHRRGFQVNMSTLAQVLDDFSDSDSTIQDALDVPVTGLEWDQLSFQIYRSSLQGDYGLMLPEGARLTPDIVYDYAITAKQAFGDRAALDLGLIRSEGSGFAGYTDPAELRADVAAALAAGVPASQLQLFALDGLREMPDGDAWAAGLPQAEPVKPPADPGTRALRSWFQVLDGL